MIDLNALEAAAKAATPGPWTVETMHSGRVTVTAGQFFIAGDDAEYGLLKDNASFIELANPAAILELVAMARGPRWIPVTERLPGNDFVEVAAIYPTRNTSAGIAEIVYGSRVCAADSIYTHWMPLPPPPDDAALGVEGK